MQTFYGHVCVLADAMVVARPHIFFGLRQKTKPLSAIWESLCSDRTKVIRASWDAARRNLA
jgi:hypothetical protein